MILANPFGGMHSTLAGLLSHLDKKKGVDYTHYGENSTKSFYTTTCTRKSDRKARG